LENRIKNLENRVAALENEVRMLKEALSFSPNKTAGFQAREETEDQRVFRIAFESLKKGNAPVKIYLIKEKLAWDEIKFSQVIKSLADEKRIKLNQADLTSLSIRALGNSYTDDAGLSYESISWQS
jgi:hypothetical protein